MTEGWTCPQCKRGVAPGEKYCDHGVNGDVDAFTRPLIPTVTPTALPTKFPVVFSSPRALAFQKHIPQ